MVSYGLKDRVALITGANTPQGIGATTAFAFAREGAKVVLIYKRVPRPFDKTKTDRNGADRYFAANAGNRGMSLLRYRTAKSRKSNVNRAVGGTSIVLSTRIV